MTKYVAYYRVSTDRQGRSGLGLDAQKAAVATYLTGAEPLAAFVEVESGKKNDRPQLQDAMDLCRRKKAVLVIAKLDRLARNLAFVANLLEAKVDLVACDMPEANRTMLQFMAVIAEHEGRVISERTKAALQAAKKRGRKLGWSMPTRQHEQAQASRNAVAYRMAKADQFATNVLPIVHDIQRTGINTLQGVAGALNARGIPTARGGTWYASTVRNLLARVPTDTASERAAA